VEDSRPGCHGKQASQPVPPRQARRLFAVTAKLPVFDVILNEVKDLSEGQL